MGGFLCTVINDKATEITEEHLLTIDYQNFNVSIKSSTTCNTTCFSMQV